MMIATRICTVVALATGVCGAAEPKVLRWPVDGTEREALVFAPNAMPKSAAMPLVFAFHGHGGTMQAVARRWKFQEAWPEAIVIYPQGLPTPGGRDPEGKRPGWQRLPGELDDRDLKFFDAALKGLREKYQVDDSRIYVVGFSNGGAFAYLLWDQRPNVLAAVAPCGSLPKPEHKLATPLPAMIVAGKKDPRVPIDRQQEAIERIRKINAADHGKPTAGGHAVYESAKGTPVETFIHPGAHLLPPGAPDRIVKFFKSHTTKLPKSGK